MWGQFGNFASLIPGWWISKKMKKSPFEKGG
jgi:hypothetical protein